MPAGKKTKKILHLRIKGVDVAKKNVKLFPMCLTSSFQFSYFIPKCYF